jgi:hypothetical protein
LPRIDRATDRSIDRYSIDSDPDKVHRTSDRSVIEQRGYQDLCSACICSAAADDDMDPSDPHFNPLFLRSSYSFSLSDPAALENLRQDERAWVAHIKKQLAQAECGGSGQRPSIFMAPSPLRGLKHEAFVPQVVALGPYHNDLGPHHSRFPRNEDTERYKALAAKEMEMHKVMASKFVERGLAGGRDLGAIVKEFEAMAGRVRAEFSTELVTCKVDEKLAYMLALDACFVVEVLKSNGRGSRYDDDDYYYYNDDGPLEERSDGGFHAYYCKRFPRPLRKSVLQDFMLLENQIPLFLLLKVIRMGAGCESDEDAERRLGAMVEEVARETLPFDWGDAAGEASVKAVARAVSDRKHLLDCLYGIVTNEEESSSSSSLSLGLDPEAENQQGGKPMEISRGGSSSSYYYSMRSGFVGGRSAAAAGGEYSTSSSLGKGADDRATGPDKEMGAGGREHVGRRFQESNLVEKPTHFPSAIELQNAGIRFKPINGLARRRHKPGRHHRSMVSVRYDERRAILYIPRIRVGDETEGFFRNLIAYESQTGGDDGADGDEQVGVLSYLRFMNCLVDTPDDVALLVERGVIAQDIGSNDEVARMWNQLCANTMRVCSRPYERVALQLVAHTRRKANTLKAEFKRTYFSRPWFLVSLLSAASLIVMTLVIMLYTIALYELEV